MKKIMIILSGCLLLSLTGFPRTTSPGKVPSTVKQAFEVKYPGATDIKYGVEQNDYQVKFREEGVRMTASFDEYGSWLMTATEIRASDLPKDVSASLAKNFAGYLISEVERIETSQYGILYEMDLDNDHEAIEVQIAPNGDILKKSPLSQEKDEDEDD
jgi:hypothetical protein